MKPSDLKALLEKLHEASAKNLLAKIESGEATAADFTAAINLLKHNDIALAREIGQEAARAFADKILPFATQANDGGYAA